MVIYLKEIGQMMLLMVNEHLPEIMVINMMVNGLTIELKEKVNQCKQMEMFMMVFGRTI